ncbi:MAG: hypothetical protein GYB64_08470 [Chloroflexi bacterium]|nr:hypothetical protein [Chloroflexota bacterium]
MTRTLFALVALLAALWACGAPAPQTSEDLIAYDESGTVAGVIDGDTVDVLIDGFAERVRYIGIDTPERDEPCYREASDANAALVQGQTVYLLRDISETDRFDRLLRYVYVEQGGDLLFVNETLVAAGYATAVRFEPDVAFYTLFSELEANARANNVGCWPTGAFD